MLTNKKLWLVVFFFRNLIASAHDCSSPGDCEETAGYNAAVAIVGGAVALGVGLMGSGFTTPVDENEPRDEDFMENEPDIEVIKNDEIDDIIDEIDDLTDDTGDDFIIEEDTGDLTEIFDEKQPVEKNEIEPTDTDIEEELAVNPKDDDLKLTDRLKSLKGLLENGSDLIYKGLSKEKLIKYILRKQVELDEIYTFKKQFDAYGKFIIKSEKDLERYRKLLSKNSKLLSKLKNFQTKVSKFKISDKFAKYSKGFDHLLHVVDAVQRVNQIAQKRGYDDFDKGIASAGEVAHKFVTIVLTKNPVVGAVDSLVGIVSPDHTIESQMRKAEDAWHEKTKEFFDNIYNNSDKIAEKQLKEFNRFKKMILKKNIPEAEKLKRIKKIYKIVVG